ncbi:YceI family protein [Pseudopedobacter saltans DSM 12145]|uniref:YceI family protein n=1 Tax=Pseudopedobacter saltans (strain ATCC 51119 / DSM 12145 / JCM 21818 / CCUG 39354 / LMG 10337 / NBRC 100064 / NCIMB 13643) TaxID=762903 RepID=F0S7F7_PSESL|nr:YceI family protein [Pseudopedobacter saltans]ADY51182.1 YceI family protein [Pseudopedobacter saltans DSM 12145]
MKWVLDSAHSELVFKVKHMMISNVKGRFNNFNVDVDGDDIRNASVKVDIKADSINTNSTDRDNHLKSADFLDVEKYPDITFVSKSVLKEDEDEFTLVGDLTIRGITKEVKVDVEFGGIGKDPWGNEKAGYNVEGKINRKDWGLNWNAALETGGVLVSDEVKFSAELQFIKQA